MQIFKNTYFEKYPQTAASINLSGAAISFLEDIYVGILQKAHMPESLLDKVEKL